MSVILGEVLAPYTSWRVGGMAERYYRPKSSEEFVQFLPTVPLNEQITCLGLGSNVLIPDHGIKGTVIHLLFSQGIEVVHATETSKTVRVETGVPCAKLAKFCVKEGLLGGEFFAGIPGTLGGALAMNAGAWGSETWRFVDYCEVVNRQGQVETLLPNAFQVGYRTVKGLGDERWFTTGTFTFQKGDPKEATLKIKALLKERQLLQPIGSYSCGSVFKNPKQNHAGRLIEAAGLKGYSIGGAEVSQKHANFILNTGSATARDIHSLIEYVRHTVADRFQILLEPEVRYLGW